MSDALLITATLLDGIAGVEPPMLDGLLECVLSVHHPKGVPGYKVDRSLPAPPQGAIPIPIARRRLGPWLVGVCSDPILSAPSSDRHDFVNKRIAVGEAGLLAPASRTVVSTTNSWTKSYRIPLRRRGIARVAWFAVGNRKGLLDVVKRVKFLGKKRSIGNGRVKAWTVERVDRDYSWFAPSPGGLVLMRTLPVGDWLPEGLIGWRRDFGGVVPPIWHPERACEVVRPC